MRRKNHEAVKLEEHDFAIDMRYIRRRETHYIVNKLGIPAWIAFAVWSIGKGIKTQLRESLSSDSKYVTLTIRQWRGPQTKSKDREFIVRFSDHDWIDKGIFRKPDFEVGLRAQTLAETISAIEKIADEFKQKIELGPQNEDGHHCELEMKRMFENGKTKFFVFCRICNRRSQMTNLESSAHVSWKNGARIPLEVSGL